jgi:hypothetical protein
MQRPKQENIAGMLIAVMSPSGAHRVQTYPVVRDHRQTVCARKQTSHYASAPTAANRAAASI